MVWAAGLMAAGSILAGGASAYSAYQASKQDAPNQAPANPAIGIGQGIQQVGAGLQQFETPKQRGKALGQAQKGFMDAAYPGTNPWERLSSGQGGAQGSVGLTNQRTQERMNERTLNTQRDIATKQAVASIGPSIIAEYPGMAHSILERVDPGGTGSVPSSADAFRNRRLAWEQQVKSIELDLRKSEVDIKSFNAATQRLMEGLAEGRLTLDNLRFEFEKTVRDRDLALKTVETFSTAFRNLTSTQWQAAMSALAGATGAAGLHSALGRISHAMDEAQPSFSAAQKGSVGGRPDPNRAKIKSMGEFYDKWQPGKGYRGGDRP
jgi:hypothetical protein